MAGTSGFEELRTTGHLRWKRTIALAMLVVTGVINYVDRSTLSIAEKPICEELGLSKGEIGCLVVGIFMELCVCAIAHRRAGRQGRACGYCSLPVWHFGRWRRHADGMVLSMRQFVATRIALGIGEAPQFPTGGARGQQLVPYTRARAADRTF